MPSSIPPQLPRSDSSNSGYSASSSGSDTSNRATNQATNQPTNQAANNTQNSTSTARNTTETSHTRTASAASLTAGPERPTSRIRADGPLIMITLRSRSNPAGADAPRLNAVSANDNNDNTTNRAPSAQGDENEPRNAVLVFGFSTEPNDTDSSNSNNGSESEINNSANNDANQATNHDPFQPIPLFGPNGIADNPELNEALNAQLGVVISQLIAEHVLEALEGPQADPNPQAWDAIEAFDPSTVNAGFIAELTGQPCPICLDSLAEMATKPDAQPVVVVEKPGGLPRLYDYRALVEMANHQRGSDRAHGIIPSPVTREPIYLDPEHRPDNQPVPTIQRISPAVARALVSE